MRRPFLISCWALVLATALLHACFAGRVPAQDEVQTSNPEAGGEHLRLETEHGPVHLWRPAHYDQRTAGMVIYIHGYYTSVDQTWADDHLAEQFQASGRNALFIVPRAPQSNSEDVSWKSLGDLLRAIESHTTFHLPPGPLVVMGHSGAYRTMILWLRDPRVQYVILLDGLYGGQAEFRSWLRRPSRSKPHRMVLVANDTWWVSNLFARRVYGTARRGSIPATSSGFTPREISARLLFLRSQYDHSEMISEGKVIPVLLQIAPLKPLVASPKPTPAKNPHNPAAHPQ